MSWALTIEGMKSTLARIISLLIVGLPFVAIGKSPIKKPPPKELIAAPAVEAVPFPLNSPRCFPGYKLVYSQNFDGNEAQVKDGFWFTNPDNWKVPAVRGPSFMEFVTKGHNYKYKVRSPYIIGLVKEVEVKDFVLEAELQQTGKEYGHRDMCVFYGFQDRSHFYYTHIASVTDAHAHNCFIVNDKPRTKISHETTKGHKWGAKDWHQVRLVREHASGKIEVYVNDMKKPIMRATDKTFDWGRIGFGTFDDTGRVRKIRLYAPESRKSKAGDPFVEGRKE